MAMMATMVEFLIRTGFMSKRFYLLTVAVALVKNAQGFFLCCLKTFLPFYFDYNCSST